MHPVYFGNAMEGGGCRETELLINDYSGHNTFYKFNVGICTPVSHSKVGGVASNVENNIIKIEVKEVFVLISLIGLHNRISLGFRVDVFGQAQLCILVNSES